MPTVILLDSSLSMFRPIPSSDATETHTRFSLACTAINTFLDYLNVHAKLEYVALVTFASNFDVAVPFTREFDIVRNKLPHIEEGDKTCLETALLGVNQLILNEWGSQTPVQTILLTDGCSGAGPIGRDRIVQALPLPPAYPLKIHVLPIAAPHEASLVHAMPLYQKLIDMAANTSNGPVAVPRGLIYCPDQLSVPGITACTLRLAAAQYQQSWLSLRCGALEARVQLFPADAARAAHVVGFLATQHLGTPITVSKHLIIPHAQPGAPRDNYEPKTPTKEGSADATDEDMSDPSKVPNFCVLLHGALKVEGMCALVQLGLGYGVIAAWCDSARARRSCLLLSVLAAPAPAPWLGPLDRLGPEQAQAESFPLRASRSYSAGGGGGGGGGGWARPHALLADVHKLLRHARKLPEKTHHLYKELNRLRRAAISLGFSELLAAVAGALQREGGALPPAARAQLQHAAHQLTEPRTALDIKFTLQPLQLHNVESID